MGQVTGIFHGGITVSDMDRSLEFYRDGLGLEIEFDRLLGAPYLKAVLALDFSELRAVYLRIPGGAFIELLEYRGIERMPARSRPSDYGAGHLCLFVDDIGPIVARLYDRGFESRSDGIVDITEGPNQGARSIYMRDPDGYSVELLQRPPGRRRRPRA